MYEIVSFEDPLTKTVLKTITRFNKDGSMTSFPIDEKNPEYQQYLVDTDGGLPLPKETK